MIDLKNTKADRTTFRKQNPVVTESKMPYVILLAVFFLIGCVESTLNFILS